MIDVSLSRTPLQEEEKQAQHRSPGTHQMIERFNSMSFVSPLPARGVRAGVPGQPVEAGRLGLTPVIEEMSNLRVTTTPRRTRQEVPLLSDSEEEKV